MKVEGAFRNLLYGLRCLARRPGFSAALVSVMAMGIASLTVTFAILHSAVLDPLPVSHIGRLLAVIAPEPPDADKLAWWSQSSAFESVAVYGTGEVNLAGGGATERVPATTASASFFSVFSVRPVAGRAFTRSEEVNGHSDVAVISDALWRRDFGEQPRALNQTIRVSGAPFTVIGVMPRGFDFPGRTQVWLPRVVGGGASLGRQLPVASQMVGLLRPGVTVNRARSNLQVLFHRLQVTYASSKIQFGLGPTVIPLRETLVRNYRPAVTALFIAACLLLLITCADAAGMLLVRGAHRRKEIAIRRSLGARASDIGLQLLAESAIAAMLAGGLGVVVSVWATRLLRAAYGSGIPYLARLRVDPAVLAFALCISLLTGILAGLFPGLQLSSADLNEALKQEGFRFAGGSSEGLRSILTAGQISVAVVLVAAAALLVQSALRLTSVDPGFDPHDVLTMKYELPTPNYRPAATEAALHGPVPKPHPLASSLPGAPARSPARAGRREKFASFGGATQPLRVALFTRELLEGTARLPGVAAAGIVNLLPLSNRGGGFLFFDLDGRQPAGEGRVFLVGGQYFRAMRIPLVSGRFFRGGDDTFAPKVVIISRAMARQLWSGGNPSGQSITLEGETEPREVVGVVGDVKSGELSEAPSSQLYVPYLQPYLGRFPPLEMTLVVRTGVEPLSLLGPARELVRSLDKGVPVFEVETMQEVVSRSTLMPRSRGLFFAIFALVALSLAVMGVYGVVAYAVASHTHEIGVRFALGARRRDIVALVLVQGGRLALIGLAAGTLLATAVHGLISHLLFGINPLDARTLAGSGLLIFGAVLLGCAVPAARASRVDPAQALRYE